MRSVVSASDQAGFVGGEGAIDWDALLATGPLREESSRHRYGRDRSRIGSNFDALLASCPARVERSGYACVGGLR